MHHKEILGDFCALLLMSGRTAVPNQLLRGPVCSLIYPLLISRNRQLYYKLLAWLWMLPTCRRGDKMCLTNRWILAKLKPPTFSSERSTANGKGSNHSLTWHLQGHRGTQLPGWASPSYWSPSTHRPQVEKRKNDPTINCGSLFKKHEHIANRREGRKYVQSSPPLCVMSWDINWPHCIMLLLLPVLSSTTVVSAIFSETVLGLGRGVPVWCVVFLISFPSVGKEVANAY